MAELDPRPTPIPEVPETVEVVEVVYETPPPNRPRKVSSSMWGTLEIAVMSASGLILITVVMVYFFWVLPSNRELAMNKSEAERLEAELISAKSKYGEITNVETQVGKLAASVDDFETRFLPLASNGQSALYQRLNGLIAAYGLVNTTGPDYSPLETVDVSSGQQTDDEKGRAKYRSLYPGVYVSTTVEGSYQNLRRFIREIETGRDFIVVSAVELAPTDTEKQTNPNSAPNIVAVNPVNPNSAGSTQKGFPPGFGPPVTVNQTQQRQRVPGKMHGETVSLHIELAAYFRRPNFVPAPSIQ
ncbi:MAG: hypothetical protein ABIO36_00505 [Pyrinomonadaceae bacterium]